MTKNEYEAIQEALTKKLYTGYCSNKQSAFNEGILKAKSIVKSIKEIYDNLTEEQKKFYG